MSGHWRPCVEQAESHQVLRARVHLRARGVIRDVEGQWQAVAPVSDRRVRDVRPTFRDECVRQAEWFEDITREGLAITDTADPLTSSPSTP